MPQARKEPPIYIEYSVRSDHYKDETFRFTVVERRPLGPRDVWFQIDDIPEDPPDQTVFPGTESGVVSGISGVVLTPVSGCPNQFESMSEEFLDMVPTSVTAGLEQYQPTLKDATGKEIPYDPEVWVADGIIKLVEFKYGVPEKVTSPLTIDYWRYIGSFGVNVTLTGLTPADETLVVDGTGPTLTIKGLTAGAGIALSSDGTQITITNTATAVTLTDGGVDPNHKTILADDTGPDFQTVGLVGGTGITLNNDGTDITITNSGALSLWELFGDATGNSVRLDLGSGTSVLDDLVFPQQSTETPSVSMVIFDTSKGAFRAGTAGATSWLDANRGTNSTAFGLDNTASGVDSFVAGGNTNVASGDDSSVVGGRFNTASGTNRTSVVGGQSNTASGVNSIIVGGINNIASGGNSVVVCGSNSTASGSFSWAAGVGSTASNTGSFVWSDSTTAQSSTIADEVTFGAAGGFRVFGNGAGNPPYVAGDIYFDAANTVITGKLTVTGIIDPTGLQCVEQTVNPGVVAPGDGTFWIRDDVPNVPMFTDDAGTDHNLLDDTGTGAFENTLVGNVTRSDILAPNYSINNDFVFGSQQLDDAGDALEDARFLFDKSAGAFRAGTATGTQWDSGSRGANSAAFGRNNIASGAESLCTGDGNTASGAESSVVGGLINVASMDRASVVGGSSNTASGAESSVVGGFGNTASGLRSATVGGTTLITASTDSFLGGGNTNSIVKTNDVNSQGGFIVGGSGLIITQTNAAENIEYSGLLGGLTNTITSNTGNARHCVILGGTLNSITSPLLGSSENSAIIAGFNNAASGLASVVVGGSDNIASGLRSFCSGGGGTASNSGSSAIGGNNNTASGAQSTVVGGNTNVASGPESAVVGGNNNTASGNQSWAAGTGSTASNTGSFVWSDSTTAQSSTIADEVTFGATGGFRVLGNGAGSPPYAAGDIYLDALNTVVTGKLTVTGIIDPTGLQCVEQTVNPGVVIAGNGTFWVRDDVPNVPMFTDDAGTDHNLLDDTGTGAFENTAGGVTRSDIAAPNYAIGNDYVFGSQQLDAGLLAENSRFLFDKSAGAFRAGTATGSQWDSVSRGTGSAAFGLDNIASTTNSFLGGGATNSIVKTDDVNSQGGFIVGGSGLVITQSGAAENIEYSGIVGGLTNTITSGGGNARHCVILGGTLNTITPGIISGENSAIIAGNNNDVSGSNSVVVGGGTNTVSGTESTVVGGSNCSASAVRSSVLGGFVCLASGIGSAVIGGQTNSASGDKSAVLGGESNLASGVESVVVGGNNNTASGDQSWAAGTGSAASNIGSFVWSDSTTARSSTAVDEVTFGATGGFRVFGNGAGNPAYAAGDIYLDALNTVVTGKLTVTGIIDPTGLQCVEQIVNPGVVIAGNGTFWVRDDVPNVPMFTDDAGTDHNLLDDTGTGAFENTAGGVTRSDIAAPNYAIGNDYVFGSQQLDAGLLAENSRFLFDKSAGAFRAGTATGSQWDSVSRGTDSAAFGLDNIASTTNSFLGGGSTNSIVKTDDVNSQGGYIVGGSGLIITQTNAAENIEYSGLLGGLTNVITSNGGNARHAAILGGTLNSIVPDALAIVKSVENSAIIGGNINSVDSVNSVIAGGISNSVVGAPESFIGGGFGHTTSGLRSAILGGISGSAFETNSAVVGGAENTASGEQSATVGGSLLTAASNDSFMGGGNTNSIVTNNNTNDQGSYIVGGSGLIITQSGAGENIEYSGIVGGLTNTITSNTGNARHCIILGGTLNSITSPLAGSSENSAIIAGNNNAAPGTNSVVVGGSTNTASGSNSITSGGSGNTASGNQSWAAGTGSTASNIGSFVWSDSTTAQSSTALDEVTFGAAGGFRVFGNGAGSPAYAAGDIYLDATNTVVTGKLTVTGIIDPTGLQCVEQIVNPGVVIAGNGTFWVRDDVPNVPMFTDDAGTDHNLLGSTGTGAFKNIVGLTLSDTAATDYNINNDFVFGSQQLDDVGDALEDSRFLFDKGVGAFRAGTATGTQWDAASRGTDSAAFGLNNIASGAESLCSGEANTASGAQSSVVGGTSNTASGVGSSVTGGSFNAASMNQASVVGGLANTANGLQSATVGGNSLVTASTDSFLGGGATNSIVINNALNSQGGFIVGGSGLVITQSGAGENIEYSGIVGGLTNTITSNTGNVRHAAILGGTLNSITGAGLTSSENSAIIAGNNNAASGANSVVVGGGTNTASGINSIVSGGSGNTASGNQSWAAGTGSTASNVGSFVWSDSTTAQSSTALDEVTFGAAGGFRVFGNGAGSPAYAAGDIYLDAANTVVTGKLTVTGIIDPTGLQCVEQIVNPGVVIAGNGTFWVRDDAPNVPMFTDDAGTDHNLLDDTGTGAFENTLVGNVTRSDILAPNYSINNDFVFGSQQLDAGLLVENERFLFDKSVGAFRAGTVTGTEWNSGSRGANSAAFGLNNTASGAESLCSGEGNTASGAESSVVGGANCTASAERSSVVGGTSNTASGLRSATVGGTTLTASSVDSFLGGGAINSIVINNATNSQGGFIVGGSALFITQSGAGENIEYSGIVGGLTNTITSNTGNVSHCVILGGTVNSITGAGLVSSENSAIIAGNNNAASGANSVVVGGGTNAASGANSVVVAGSGNTASGNQSWAAGTGSTASNVGSFVWSDSTTAQSSTALDEVTFGAAGGFRVFGNGAGNPVYTAGDIYLDALNTVVTGKLTVTGIIDPTGLQCVEQASNPGEVTASDGTFWILNDTPNIPMFTDGAGVDHNLMTDTIGAFEITSEGVTRPNTLSANYNPANDFVFGSQQLNDVGDSDEDERFLFDKSSGAFRAGTATSTQWDTSSRGMGSAAFGTNNTASGLCSFSMGSNNTTASTDSFLGGGSANSISIINVTNSQGGYIVGGSGHVITQSEADENIEYSGIVGGLTNVITSNGGNARHAAILAGTLNSIVASGGIGATPTENSVIVGGNNNTVNGPNSVIAGGTSNTTSGSNSLCAGATANDNGNANTFVWSDTSGLTATAATANSWWVGAQGGSTFYSDAGRTTGVVLAGGSSAWAAVSDRNMKENIVELENRSVLDLVDQLPVFEYNYKGQPAGQKYRGPMAQDWHKLFPSDKDALRIDTMDLDGIALAAIKGLSEVVKSQAGEIRNLTERLEALERGT